MKQFRVSFTMLCAECSDVDDLMIKELPLRIAEQSLCSCGATLKLTDHSIRTSSNDIEIEATYICVSCSVKKTSFVSRIMEGLAKLWRDTAVAEIGLEGVRYEK